MNLKKLFVKYSSKFIAYLFSIYAIIFSVLYVNNELKVGEEHQGLNENFIIGFWIVFGLFIGYNWGLIVWKFSKESLSESHLRVIKKEKKK